ncbi:ABC transporter ATP-binding protein [Escherichia coli]|uniref:ABC transporter ATP-binding protein n=1 Tax=Escherichia coli TaxID=562 RepID=A0A3S4K401_ECOLX|nr:ABC transporter ATP-binding protein [Escherichia coli]
MTIALELQQLKKTYSGGVQALRGIDLQVEAGDFYALLGPNGAGKSTTIGIISSLVNKTSGRVSVFGYDLEKDVVNAKRQLGLVPQEFNFNPFETVQQIVVNQAGYYGVERKEAYIRSEKYLKQLDLWGKRNERARMLSGGMKRRLMIARALMHEPKLLILDETDRRRGYRTSPLNVGLFEGFKRQRHHHHSHHTLPGRSRNAVPQYRHYSTR